MKSRITPHRITSIRLALLCLVLGLTLFFNVLVMKTNRSVRITKFTVNLMDRSYDKAILYRFGNGTYEEAKIPRPTTTVVVDWVFPEKMKGEYIKYDMSVHFDPMGVEKLYYKDGRSIYQNSIHGEEVVFQLPWFQNVKFEIGVSISTGEFLLLMTNDDV
ncbi:hypothetical protein BC833DRAFT_582027 [Globomyces pollinis-pini]|nr:hypothetical protein BC833DRAFT_582027 [Globomyces pollinis-pini]